MTKIVRGEEVATHLYHEMEKPVAVLKAAGIIPALAIVRVGEKESDAAYERGAVKRLGQAGAEVRCIHLPETATEGEVLGLVQELNRDKTVHGILIMRPLPLHIDNEVIRNALLPEKDVDGITDRSLNGVVTGMAENFAPCTAQACIEILDWLEIDLKGKDVTVVGSSLVVGKPVSMMLLNRMATVTICHIETKDVPLKCRNADIIIAAAGCRGLIGETHLKEGQVVLDVGINVDENGRLCGDVSRSAAEGTVEIMTPVPGGVGTVTSAVLAKHVVLAALEQNLLNS